VQEHRTLQRGDTAPVSVYAVALTELSEKPSN